MASKVSQCTCGNNVKNPNEKPLSLSTHVNPRENVLLDASFVHLPVPSHQWQNSNGNNIEQGDINDARDLYNNQGILNSYRHINTLLQIAEGHLGNPSEEDFINTDTCLCANCVER